MKAKRMSASVTALVFLTLTPVYAAGARGQAAAAGRGHVVAIAQTHGPSKAPSHPTGQGHSSPPQGATSGKSGHTPAKAPKANAGTPTSSTTPTTTGTTTSPTSPIAQKIASHPQLASRLEAMLPAGMTLNQAALGFRNQGQFIAALHVSQNLVIPFADLKAQMVDKHLSLGQSIQTLKPAANSTTATKQAEVEAHNDVKHADSPGEITKTEKPIAKRVAAK